MASLFGASRNPPTPTASPSGTTASPLVQQYTDDDLPVLTEVAARMEALKASVRNELAMQNAQELMSVSWTARCAAQRS